MDTHNTASFARQPKKLNCFIWCQKIAFSPEASSEYFSSFLAFRQLLWLFVFDLRVNHGIRMQHDWVLSHVKPLPLSWPVLLQVSVGEDSCIFVWNIYAWDRVRLDQRLSCSRVCGRLCSFCHWKSTLLVTNFVGGLFPGKQSWCLTANWSTLHTTWKVLPFNW